MLRWSPTPVSNSSTSRTRTAQFSRTATLLGQFADPSVTSSTCCGSAPLLANSDCVISRGWRPPVDESRPDGTPVFQITFNGLFSYRVRPVADDRLTPAALRVGMNGVPARVTARHATNAIEGPGPRETRPPPCGVVAPESRLHAFYGAASCTGTRLLLRAACRRGNRLACFSLRSCAVCPNTAVGVNESLSRSARPMTESG